MGGIKTTRTIQGSNKKHRDTKKEGIFHLKSCRSHRSLTCIWQGRIELGRNLCEVEVKNQREKRRRLEQNLNYRIVNFTH